MAQETDRERRRRRRDRRDTAAEVGQDGVEAALDGCGCDINLLIALTLLAAVPLLLWSL